MFAHGVTVTVERPSGFDRHDNPLPAATHEVVGAFAPAGSSEDHDRVRMVEWDEDFLCAHDADLKADDVVIYDGHRYQVDGRPARWRHPMTGWSAGTVAHLKARGGE